MKLKPKYSFTATFIIFITYFLSIVCIVNFMFKVSEENIISKLLAKSHFERDKNWHYVS